MHDRVNEINNKIGDIGQQIKNIKSLLSTLCRLSTGAAPGGSSVDQKAVSGQAVTYASVAVASKDLKDAVQFAVDATIRKHENEDRDHASVAIHNFRDCWSDDNDVREFCEFIEYNVCIVRKTRIGRVVKAKKPRLLKVELASSADRDILLRAAKYLKNDPSTNQYTYRSGCNLMSSLSSRAYMITVVHLTRSQHRQRMVGKSMLLYQDSY